jgi:hypothetical protein
VDKKPNWAKKAGVTPGKLTLIGVLAVVLGAVLYLQLGSATKKVSSTALSAIAAAESTANLRESATAGAAALVPTVAPRKKTGARSSWQSPDLASVVQYDPFALPASFPQPRQFDDEMALAQSAAQTQDASVQQAALEAERTKSQTELKGLRQQGVHVIIKRKKEYVAIVGDQEVHVGDQINGFTVIAIDAEGVQVAKDLGP